MESSHQYGKDTQENGGFPWRALAWSLGAHTLVLLALAPVWPQGESGAPPAQRLLARLRSTPAPVPDPAVLPAPTFPASVKNAKPAAPPALTAQAASTVAEASLPALPPPSVGGEPVSAVVAMPSVALPLLPGESAAPDAAGLRQYRLALAREARRYKRYPDAARRAGWSGTVEVRINVITDGIAPQAELIRSSGYALLDAAALEMLRQASGRTVLPESLRHQPVAVVLPVVFEVDE